VLRHLEPRAAGARRSVSGVGRIVEPERQPWEPLPGEKPTAYYAFSLYRGLGPKRTLREVCDILKEALRSADPNRDPAITPPPVMRVVDLDALRNGDAHRGSLTRSANRAARGFVGDALAPVRGQVVIATKFGFDIDPKAGSGKK
jgi:hypothetical protein